MEEIERERGGRDAEGFAFYPVLCVRYLCEICVGFGNGGAVSGCVAAWAVLLRKICRPAKKNAKPNVIFHYIVFFHRSVLSLLVN